MVEVRRRLGVIPDSSLTVIKILFIFLWFSENDFKCFIVGVVKLGNVRKTEETLLGFLQNV